MGTVVPMPCEDSLVAVEVRTGELRGVMKGLGLAPREGYAPKSTRYVLSSTSESVLFVLRGDGCLGVTLSLQCSPRWLA